MDKFILRNKDQTSKQKHTHSTSVPTYTVIDSHNRSLASMNQSLIVDDQSQSVNTSSLQHTPTQAQSKSNRFIQSTFKTPKYSIHQSDLISQSRIQTPATQTINNNLHKFTHNENTRININDNLYKFTHNENIRINVNKSIEMTK